MLRISKVSVLLLLGLMLILAVLIKRYWVFTPDYEWAGAQSPIGFTPVECWFESQWDWPKSECYFMQVPENHAEPKGRVISFPVVVFRSSSWFKSANPVLHLGAGGPGAAMSFESAESVRTIWEYHDEISLKQGRDLFAIDPRGSGLAKPLLSCSHFVDNELKRLGNNIPFAVEWELVKQDYYRCIKEYTSQGIDLGAYNSISVAKDVERMRQAAHVKQWVFVGVSYSTYYAQLIAHKFPETVESMVLDSAVFPNLKIHHNFIERAMAPLEALYDYCDADEKCQQPLEGFKDRLWGLHKALNASPIEVTVSNWSNDQPIQVLLNGERFLASLVEGVYGVQVFKDMASIITELEQRKTDAILPYLEAYVSFMLDRTYGDVSAGGHYCYDDHSFIDHDLLKTLIMQLPEPYLREVSLLTLGWPDYCERILSGPVDPIVAAGPKMVVPTLFLHGDLDPITPLDDVLSQKQRFPNSRVASFSLSHSVLSSDECSELVAGEFVEKRALSLSECDALCGRPVCE